MERLAERARPDDAVVFYFSGHGGRVNGRFSLCPYDALRGAGKNDITDEELSAWVQRLQTRNVTLILDCCFNEIVAKGIRRRPKFMPVRDQMPPRGLSIPADRAVVLRASADGEEAQQELLGQGLWVGVFTLHLYQELMRANPETTYQRLMQAVRHNVNQYIAKTTSVTRSTRTRKSRDPRLRLTVVSSPRPLHHRLSKMPPLFPMLLCVAYRAERWCSIGVARPESRLARSTPSSRRMKKRSLRSGGWRPSALPTCAMTQRRRLWLRSDVRTASVPNAAPSRHAMPKMLLGRRALGCAWRGRLRIGKR
jgi:hypothetical protein